MEQIVIAHKGACGYAPENTLLSFQRAIDLGAHMIELDLHETVDGELVCIHDSSVDRTTNGSGEVHSFTYRELQKLDAGEGQYIPLLEEVLKLCFGKLQVNIELKVIGVEKKVLDLVERLNMLNDIIVSSFYHGTLVAIKEMNETTSTAILVKDPMDDFVQYALNLRANAINPNYQLVNQEMVAESHHAGLKVYPWTVNNSHEMKQLYTVGVDGVITDYPDRAFDVLGQLD